MTSSHPEALLHINSGCNPPLCPATNATAPGFAVCSLPAGAHKTHQLRCEDTGALLGEWTDADMTFREPVDEPCRDIEFREPLDEPSWFDIEYCRRVA